MQTGLAVGTPLVVSSGDHQCEVIGMGNVRGHGVTGAGHRQRRGGQVRPPRPRPPSKGSCRGLCAAQAEATALGAAMIGAVGVGVFNDLPEAAKSMVHIGSRYEPLTKNIPRYNEMYEVSLSTYEAREGGDVFRKIARAQGL